MKIRSFFRQQSALLCGRKKDTVLVFFTILLLTCMLILFYAFDASSDSFVSRIEEEIPVQIKVKGFDLKTYKEEKEYLVFMDGWLEFDKKWNDDDFTVYSTAEVKVKMNGFDLTIFASDATFEERYYTVIEGRNAIGENEILVREDLVLEDRLIRMGDSLKLEGDQEYEVVGIFKAERKTEYTHNDISFESADILLLKEDFSHLSNFEEGRTSDLHIGLRGNIHREEAILKLEGILREINNLKIPMEIEVDDALAKSLGEPVAKSRELYRLVSVLMFVAIGFLIISCLTFVIKRRYHEFAIWISLGRNKAMIFLHLLLNIMFISIITFVLCIPMAKLIFFIVDQIMVYQNQISQLAIVHLEYLNGMGVSEILAQPYHLGLTEIALFNLLSLQLLFVVISCIIAYLLVLFRKWRKLQNEG